MTNLANDSDSDASVNEEDLPHQAAFYLPKLVSLLQVMKPQYRVRLIHAAFIVLEGRQLRGINVELPE